jgi:hypothetical protein
MDPLNHVVPKWTEKFQKQQYITEDYFLNDEKAEKIVYGKGKFNEYAVSHGSGLLAWTTKLACIYLAGLAFARTQHIPGFLYFKNRNYNFVGALKYLAAGYVVGETLSIFAFGSPYLVEDQIRRKLRALTGSTYFESGPLLP